MNEDTPELQALFDQARAHHQAGRRGEAERLYRRILHSEPDHADSLHLLGVLAAQAGSYDAAQDLIGKAIALDGGVDAYHANLGLVLQALGQIEDAARHYRRAIALKPEVPEAHNNLGNLLLQQGLPDEALARFQTVLDLGFDFPETHNSRGLALHRLGRLDEAMACFRKAIAGRGQYPEALFNLGISQQALGDLRQAIGSYRAALFLAPGNPGIHNNLGLALLACERADEAVDCFKNALRLQPDLADVYGNLGLAYQKQERLGDAATSYRRTLRLQPADADALNDLGTALHQQGHRDRALACWQDAAALRPEDPKIHYNLGRALQEQARLDETLTHYRRAIALAPDHAGAHNNLAMALLAGGDLAAGWPEYEWRWRTAEGDKLCRRFCQPQWRGEAAAGKRLLIHAEQGFGDSLQFCRYAPLAAARGLAVTLVVQKPLVRLLQTLPGVARVIAEDAPLPDFDLHCPMLSLPLALGTTIDDIPAGPAYLQADERLVARWRARLATLSRPGRRVGLVWAGGLRAHSPLAAAVDRRRSIEPGRLAPLLAVPGLQFVSLQKGGPAAPAAFPLIDPMDEVEDFADTAALIANLDLVVSVDTAVVHLAGALGKPVWMLDRFDACWRWLKDRQDSPWYPSLRIFRQPAIGDWTAVIERVAALLAEHPHSISSGPIVASAANC